MCQPKRYAVVFMENLNPYRTRQLHARVVHQFWRAAASAASTASVAAAAAASADCAASQLSFNEMTGLVRAC